MKFFVFGLSQGIIKRHVFFFWWPPLVTPTFFWWPQGVDWWPPKSSFWWPQGVDWWPPKSNYWWPPALIGDPQKLKKSKNQISIKFFSDYDWVSKTSLRCVFSISNIRLSIWYMYNRFFDFFQKCDLGRFLWPDSCDPKQYVSRLKIVLSQKINVGILKN